MKVTICELSDNEEQFVNDWKQLQEHTQKEVPDLVLLPELPFCQWVASNKDASDKVRKITVQKHTEWLTKISELTASMVVYSKPVVNGSKFHNTAFLWDRQTNKHHELHSKSFFPEEEHFYEDTWYDSEDGSFDVFNINGLRVGVLICTEVWFTQYARKYGEQKIDLLLCPRATGASSVPHWVRCGQTLAVISGAYSLSSNRSGLGLDNFEWGGNGWIAAPMTGELLGKTNTTNPFVTLEIDLNLSKEAKKEYPLYVRT